ncbi:MAG: hypothetical protein ACYC61_22900, partial [Isosphaeraceae bacterium]
MTLLKLAIGMGLLMMAGSAAMVQARQDEAVSDDNDKEKPCKPEDLVGRYTIVSGEKYGMKEPDERIKG